MEVDSLGRRGKGLLTSEELNEDEAEPERGTT